MLPRISLLFIHVIHLSASHCLNHHGTSYCFTIQEENSIKFALIGDWGGRAEYPFFTKTQQIVAKALNLVQEQHEPVHFYVSTGDNFYPKGVKGVDDPRFTETFENVYTSKNHHKPWYIVAGNHDYNGKIAAQLAYTNHSKRWVFPSNFYTLSFSTNDASSIDFVMIDTIKICGHERDDDVGVADSNSNLHPNITNVKQALQWIDEALRESRADYLVVVGHYPIISAGFHGPNKCMKKYVLPLLTTHQVTAYLSGHDHTLQHLTIPAKTTGKELHLIVSGMGAKRDRLERTDKEVRPAKKNFFYPKGTSRTSKKVLGRRHFSRKSKGGFVYCNVSKTAANFKFVDAQGKLVYAFDAQPKY